MVIDFTSPSQLRQFELSFGDDHRKLYVNQHYLAELSPYFLALCFTPGFRETCEGKVNLPDVYFEDMEVLLNHICPGDTFRLESRICVDNFAILTRLSERLMLTNLRCELENRLNSDSAAEACIDGTCGTTAQLMEILIETMAAYFNEEAVMSVCKILAKKDLAEVTELMNTLQGEYGNIIRQKLTPLLQFYHMPKPCKRFRRGGFETIHKRLFF
uniref:BTB domain-containing protein n=1 Tax=Panagrellus redivivus TaxID=6233 RepID=A0A7E4V1D0_PANRE